MDLLQAYLTVHMPADAKSDQPGPPPSSPSSPLYLLFFPSPLLLPNAPARLPLQGACAHRGKGRRAVRPARRDGRVPGERERKRGLGGPRGRTRSTGRTREDCDCGTRWPRTFTPRNHCTHLLHDRGSRNPSSSTTRTRGWGGGRAPHASRPGRHHLVGKATSPYAGEAPSPGGEERPSMGRSDFGSGAGPEPGHSDRKGGRLNSPGAAPSISPGRHHGAVPLCRLQ